MCSPLLVPALIIALTAGPADPRREDIQAPPRRVGPVTARLLPADGAWHPGATQLVGVLLTLEPGWHLYWHGANDSGLPIRVSPDLPPGFQASELLWPAPERLVHAGDLVDHVYTGEVTLLLPVQVPSDLEHGATLELGCQVSWLVCEEACLPGRADLSLRMTIGEAAPARSPGGATDSAAPTPSESGRLALGSTTPPLPPPIARALARLPGPAPASLSVHWQTDGALLRWPGARRLAFYPAAVGLSLLDIAGTCAAMGDRLDLRLDPEPYPPPPQADPDQLGRLRGVLEIWTNKDNNSYLCVVDLPGPPTPPAPPTPHGAQRTSTDHDPEQDPR